MGYLHEVPPGESTSSSSGFLPDPGFVPRLFRAQIRLPRVVDAEAEMAAAVLLRESELTRIQKESVLLVVAGARRNPYCVAAPYRTLQSLGVPEERLERLLADPAHAGLRREDALLLGFCLKLALRPATVAREDCQALRKAGLVDEEILEAILVTGLTEFLCTMSTGLGLEPESPLRTVLFPADLSPDTRGAGTSGGRAEGEEHSPSARPGVDPRHFPHLRAVDLSPDLFPPFAFFKERFGFIPNLFRAQTLRPDVVAAEARVVDTVLLHDEVLPRRLKEYILLAISAAYRNTYCVALHSEMLLALGVPAEQADQIALDYRQARLSESDRALLDFAVKLGLRPEGYGPPDVEILRRYGFTEDQILEAIVMTSLTRFLNTLQAGLGTVPDFEPRIDYARIDSTE